MLLRSYIQAIRVNLNIQSVEIYNMMGQIILADSKVTASIHVSSLINGNYNVKVNTEKGIVNTKFIMK
jgi:Secretion system C-terminal sorting domain